MILGVLVAAGLGLQEPDPHALEMAEWQARAAAAAAKHRLEMSSRRRKAEFERSYAELWAATRQFALAFNVSRGHDWPTREATRLKKALERFERRSTAP